MSGLRARSGVLALALVLLVGAAACGYQKPRGDEPEPEVLATAGPASGLMLAYGTLVRGDEPVEGATVVLQATPITSAAETDEGAQRWSAPAVSTAADGSWELSLDPTDIPTAYYPDNYTFLEFDLVFGDGAGVAVWRGTVYLRTRPDLWRTEGAGPRDGVLRVDVDLESGDVTAIDSRGEPITVD